ncbi:hypothetical protein MA9V1_024 [Chryseobacterium phage MA9V-1]|nr:hypothetical protein MA9V1_024 [Chryseobacterium phage MA9V-1]
MDNSSTNNDLDWLQKLYVNEDTELTPEEIADEFGDYRNDKDNCPHNQTSPIVGFGNEIIGEYCTQCDQAFNNYGRLM